MSDNLRTVRYLLPAELINMGGFPVRQALPTQQVPQLDPFLLVHHARVKFNPDAPARHQGIGPHPHRGFSPVTFVVDGELRHRDSRGHDQTAGAGDVQWMHAGAGIIHSERPSQALVARQGHQEIVQIWINSPSDKKLTPPTYQHIAASELPVYQPGDSPMAIRVVAGKAFDLQGPARTMSDQLILWGSARGEVNVTLPVPPTFNAMLYLIRGSLSIHGYGTVSREQLVIFDTVGDVVALQLSGGSHFLLLAGQPLEEPMVQQGPFVMNSEHELLVAMRDYHMGKMGMLIEDD